MMRYISGAFLLAAICTFSTATASCWDSLARLCCARKSATVEVIPPAKNNENYIKRQDIAKQLALMRFYAQRRNDIRRDMRKENYKNKLEEAKFTHEYNKSRSLHFVREQAQRLRQINSIDQDPLDLNENENEEEKVTQS